MAKTSTTNSQAGSQKTGAVRPQKKIAMGGSPSVKK